MKQRLLSRVVVATDFSAGALQALERALTLPLGLKGTVTVLHVIPDDIPGKLAKQARAEANQSIEKLLVRAKPAVLAAGLTPARVEAEVLEGVPVKALSARARALKAELFVLGRHGRRPVADLFMGSTAQRLVRALEVPVLLVQTPAATPWKKALTATAIEPKASALLKLAATVAPAAELLAFNASLVPFEEYVTLSGEVTAAFRDECLEEATERLAGLVRSSGVAATASARSGDPRLLIIEEALAFHANLIVLGTHAPKGLKRLVLGSVAEWVLGHAVCDVLVARV
jgi:nucleotide-binding universal stress UspA family protein